MFYALSTGGNTFQISGLLWLKVELGYEMIPGNLIVMFPRYISFKKPV